MALISLHLGHAPGGLKRQVGLDGLDGTGVIMLLIFTLTLPEPDQRGHGHQQDQAKHNKQTGFAFEMHRINGFLD